jgi:hypothetical protein
MLSQTTTADAKQTVACYVGTRLTVVSINYISQLYISQLHKSQLTITNLTVTHLTVTDSTVTDLILLHRAGSAHAVLAYISQYSGVTCTINS